ncbi:Multidrug and toxin extrusion (MATE) family efflux pump YdhE/NorM [Minicystis rosea]|nr:Multidrug and toxin extrusion (MATE) family efflux pump YdhE/NorM [Minicystis rosea]
MRAREEVRETLRLAVPIAFAQVALMTMGLVDTALVGRVSKLDMAAVAIGNQLAFAALCAPMGVTMAVEPLASQAIGAGDPRRAWNALRAGIVACLLLSIPTMIVAAVGPFVLGPLGIEASIVPPARSFVFARIPGMPMWLLFMAAKAYLEARGITRPLFLGGWLANVINFVVVSLLVFGDRALTYAHLPAIGLPALGSLGAGLGTTISSFALAVIALWAAWRARPEGATLFGGDRAELIETTRKLLRVGVPMGLQILTEAGVFLVVGLVVGRLGKDTTSAQAIAMGLASYTFMGVLGISSATAVRVGRAIGARDEGGPRRAGAVGLGLAAAYMFCCALVFIFFAEPLARLFTPDVGVQQIAVDLIRIAAAFQIADGIQGVSGGALRGAADTRFASWANVACHWGVGLPLALLFGFALGYGAKGLWWGLSAGLVVVAVVLTKRFWRISAGAIEAI